MIGPDDPTETMVAPGPGSEGGPATEALQVVVLWDGAWLTPPPSGELGAAMARHLVTLPPGSLQGYRGAGLKAEDRLLDDVLDWAARRPTLIVPWRGIPESTVRQLAMGSRLVDRDAVVTLPAVTTPLVALSVGWQVAWLATAVALGAREALSVASHLVQQTVGLLVLARPGRSALLDLGALDLLRALRPGPKVVRPGRRLVLSSLSAGAPLLRTDPATGSAAPAPGDPTVPPGPSAGGPSPPAAPGLAEPRMIFRLRSGEGPRFELGSAPGDLVVDMQPGSLDADAWGQRNFAEVAVGPLGLSRVPSPASGWRLCPGCEALVPERDPCGTCRLHYE